MRHVPVPAGRRVHAGRRFHAGCQPRAGRRPRALRRLRAAACWPAAVLIALVGLVGFGSAASAHTSLVSTQPPDGATVDTAPTAVELVFSQSPGGVGPITVTGPDGTVVSTGSPTQDGARVSQPLGELPGPGRYTVSYQVLASDGHRLTGTFSFTSTAAGADPSATTVSTTFAAAPGTGEAAGPEADADAAEEEADEKDGRDVSSTVIGAVIVLVVLGVLVLVLLRLRSARRG